MTQLSISHVEPNYIQQVWPDVKEYIDVALKKGKSESLSPDYNLDHVQSYLTSGEWLLVVAADEDKHIRGCATVSFCNYPMSRIAFVTSTAGKWITKKPEFEKFKKLLQAHGATKIQALGRDSMVRLCKRHKFESVNTLLEVDI
jgi:hypothetical protein|tara:strand:+ start:1891 stop:2322 length:432 start_codon:yes stop_codon:yes gene_type:complete